MFFVYFFLSTASATLVDDIRSALEQKISDELQISSSDIVVGRIAIANIDKCSQPTDLDIKFASNEDFIGPVDVTVTAYNQQQKCNQWRVNVQVSIYAEVCVAPIAVNAEEEVSCEVKRARIDNLTHNPVTNSGPWLARKKLRKGVVLTQANVRIKPLLKSGDNVQVVFKRGALLIRAEGRLLSDAVVGKKVRVSLSNQTIREGILLDTGVIELR